MYRIKTALISVSDKTKLNVLAEKLLEKNVTIYSTGGTLDYLRDNFYKLYNNRILDVYNLTYEKPMLDGLVKTLHPKIYAGILAKRNDKYHLQELRLQFIDPIDLVVCNFYPLKLKKTMKEYVSQLDIGSPCMLRAALKNHEYVYGLSSPDQYDKFLEYYVKYYDKDSCKELSIYREALGIENLENIVSYDSKLLDDSYYIED